MILPKNGSSFGSFFRTVKNNKKYPKVDACRNLNPHCSDNDRRFVIIPFTMLMYGKEASNRKQEIERRYSCVVLDNPTKKLTARLNDNLCMVLP